MKPQNWNFICMLPTFNHFSLNKIMLLTRIELWIIIDLFDLAFEFVDLFLISFFRCCYVVHCHCPERGVEVGWDIWPDGLLISRLSRVLGRTLKWSINKSSNQEATLQLLSIHSLRKMPSSRVIKTNLDALIQWSPQLAVIQNRHYQWIVPFWQWRPFRLLFSLKFCI